MKGIMTGKCSSTYCIFIRYFTKTKSNHWEIMYNQWTENKKSFYSLVYMHMHVLCHISTFSVRAYVRTDNRRGAIILKIAGSQIHCFRSVAKKWLKLNLDPCQLHKPQGVKALTSDQWSCKNVVSHHVIKLKLWSMLLGAKLHSPLKI